MPQEPDMIRRTKGRSSLGNTAAAVAWWQAQIRVMKAQGCVYTRCSEQRDQKRNRTQFMVEGWRTKPAENDIAPRRWN